jgi:hypothetical protein
MQIIHSSRTIILPHALISIAESQKTGPDARLAALSQASEELPQKHLIDSARGSSPQPLDFFSK